MEKENFNNEKIPYPTEDINNNTKNTIKDMSSIPQEGTKLTLEMYQQAQTQNVPVDFGIPSLDYYREIKFKDGDKELTMVVPTKDYQKNENYGKYVEMKKRGIQKFKDDVARLGSASVASYFP